MKDLSVQNILDQLAKRNETKEKLVTEQQQNGFDEYIKYTDENEFDPYATQICPDCGSPYDCNGIGICDC